MMTANEILTLAAQYRQQRDREALGRVMTTRQTPPNFPAALFQRQDRARQSMAEILLTGRVARKQQRR